MGIYRKAPYHKDNQAGYRKKHLIWQKMPNNAARLGKEKVSAYGHQA
jgi:hypothetical protein